MCGSTFRKWAQRTAFEEVTPKQTCWRKITKSRWEELWLQRGMAGVEALGRKKASLGL